MDNLIKSVSSSWHRMIRGQEKLWIVYWPWRLGVALVANIIESIISSSQTEDLVTILPTSSPIDIILTAFSIYLIFINRNNVKNKIFSFLVCICLIFNILILLHACTIFFKLLQCPLLFY